MFSPYLHGFLLGALPSSHRCGEQETLKWDGLESLLPYILPVQTSLHSSVIAENDIYMNKK